MGMKDDFTVKFLLLFGYFVIYDTKLLLLYYSYSV